MIDEELYQQAADELNSDRRRPHIWARACALASDDHDEARYLYTNLRVEELIAEREKATSSAAHGTNSIDDAYTELSLVDVDTTDAPDADDIDGFKNELSDESFESELDRSEAEALSLADDPDKDLMADYVPEEPASLDDTYTAAATDEDDTVSISGLADDTVGMGAFADDTYTADSPADESYSGEVLAEEDLAQELASFKAEEGEPEGIDPAGSDTDNLPAETNADSQSIPTLHDGADDEHAANGSHADVFDIGADTNADITDLTAAHPNDLTQANVDVLDAHANDLDEMLGETGYQTPLVEESDANVLWMDEELPTDTNTARPANRKEPFIYEDDPYTDELSRQADELDLGSTTEPAVDYSLQLSDELSEDEYFPKSTPSQPEASKPAVEVSEAVDDRLSVAAADGSTATAAVSAPSVAAHIDNAATPLEPTTSAVSVWPMDLTEGRKGKLFSIYRRNNDAQAVRNGVSWSALFLTLPYLLYRHLFGTALAYCLLWLVVVGGLIVSALAWLDAGASVTPLTQACTIGFALLAFIGLIYLPFRYGNIWRSERLEDRGYELVATARARNPGRAIARARRHAALGN